MHIIGYIPILFKINALHFKKKKKSETIGNAYFN